MGFVINEFRYLARLNPRIAKGFRDGLRSLGYVDGKNVILLPRYAQGDYAQFPQLLSELIAADVDVLFVPTAVVQAAVQTTRTIPIVAPVMANPIRDGLVNSIAHPGGNLTGGSGLSEMDSKRLQFAMELVPGLKCVGLLFEATNPQFENGAKANRVLADGLGLSLHTYGVRNLDEIRSAFTRFDKDRIQVLIPKIGVLVRVAANWPGEQAFLEGLNRRGYVVGKNVVIEWRRASTSGL